jgi:hypothetical protein
MAAYDTEPTKAQPKSDAYTGMLVVSLIALLAGCALLFLDYRRYPSKEPPALTPTQKTTK